MAKSGLPSGSPFKRVADALDCGYEHRQAEMLRWMLCAGFEVMGMKPFETIPEKAMPKVRNALKVYEETVLDCEPFTDILGPVYMDLASRWGRSALGQFFTPQSIAVMMAMMTIGDEAPRGRLVTACDPTCGSGVMMLSLAQVLLRQGEPDRLRRYSFTGVDLDPICARMMAMQFLANCAIHRLEVGELVVFWGDSLLPWTKMDLLIHATSPSLQPEEVVPAAHPARIWAIQAAAQSQLPLFEEWAA
jgi:hypothetical protein